MWFPGLRAPDAVVARSEVVCPTAGGGIRGRGRSPPAGARVEHFKTGSYGSRDFDGFATDDYPT